MLAVGEKIEAFDLPICNAFTPRILNFQLCYQLDLKDKHIPNFKGQPYIIFLLDYNEDHQLPLVASNIAPSDVYKNMNEMMASNHRTRKAMIFIESLGIGYSNCTSLLYHSSY